MGEHEDVKIPESGWCAICHSPYTHYGHNPEPVMPYLKRVCNVCNQVVVIPARVAMLIRMSGSHDLTGPEEK